MKIFRAAGFVFLVGLVALPIPAQTPVKSDSILSYQATAAGVSFTTQHGVLAVRVVTDSTIRVVFESGRVGPHPQPWIVDVPFTPVRFTVTENAGHNIVIATKRLRIVAERDSSALTFTDAHDAVLLRESPSPRPRELTPIALDGEKAYHADAYFDLTQDEAIYGLGQHQSGLLNQRGTDVLLMQDNTNISITFLLSSRGYGLLWNSASLGRYENHFQPKLALRADVADAVDYYFIYGPEFDGIIAGYRGLTGEAPLLPRFAYGFWQSRWQYGNQQEFVGIATKYRELKIPLDILVLDENWATRMGAGEFTPNFQDAPGMFDDLRKLHVHAMISVWPLFTPPSANFDFMRQHGYFVTGGRTEIEMYDRGRRLLDAYNLDGRKAFWKQLHTDLFSKGVEGWWLDSSEPLDSFGEEQGAMLEGAHTALGSGSRYANMYPLLETKAVYDGQRSSTDQRVFILTRSAFLGQQRNAAIAWSGDIAPTFDSLRRQIPAGLNVSMSGLPYWTTDIGGFQGGNTDDPAYRELYIRWFEYGTFCPIFRTHGARKANELWSYGLRAQEILTKYDKLRYRLLPYIYSVAWMTTSKGYTPMRALVMDFPFDHNALDISDQFMFGPALLVNPVTAAGATTRALYLPAGGNWFDFWTGESQRGGRTIVPPALIETIPLYVRAGSILPMGPDLQWTSEKPADPIELRIYPGADGELTLYEDDGASYAYERGQHSTIPIHWNDANGTLTLGARSGSFPGMLAQRTFDIVLIRKGLGLGGAVTKPDRVVKYDGTAITVQVVGRP